MRSAIEQVFKYYSNDVTDDGLLRMLKVIKKDLKPARRQETDSEDDVDTDDDLLGIEEAENSDEAETGETGEVDDQSEDSEGIVGVEVVKKELPENSDDSDGDDEAMFRMDSYLGQIFKEKRNQAGGKTAHSQFLLFKLRVLSVLEIYLHENQGKPQVLKVFSSLAQAFVNPHTTKGSEQLGERICKVMENKIFKAKHYPKGESVQPSMLEPLREKNLKLASKRFKKKKSAINPSKKKQSASSQRYRIITNLAQNSTYWILKIVDSRNCPEAELQRVFDILKGALVAYFDSKKSQLKPQFLKEIIRRWPWVGHHFFGFLLEKCSSASSKFTQVEALDLVLETLKPIISVNTNGSNSGKGKKMVKVHLPKLSALIKELVTNMPEKQARRAEVRKFCGKIFNILSRLKLTTLFLDSLEPYVHSACDQLGKTFLDMKQQEG